MTSSPVRHHARPTVEARRRGVRGYLLNTVAAGANVSGAIRSLLDLSDTDPARYVAIVGSERILSQETVRDYWQAIPLQVRTDVVVRSRAQRRGTPTKGGPPSGTSG